MEVSPGAIIGGRYRAERRLGKGGVGEVWEGVALADGSRVAIKTLLRAASNHHELVTRFRREADFLERIRSQYVSRVLEFLSDDVFGLVLVMELIEGEPLSDVLRRGPLAVEDAIDVCWDVLGGIADLHRQQIIHRDLKPGNIILQELPSGKRRAVIVDFGMSRFTGRDADGEEVTALTRVDIAVGTMEYMAPEQILDSRGVTGSADIYALGAMLYRAVAGHHMFGDLTDAVLARHKLLNDPPPLDVGRDDPLAAGFAAVVMRMVQRKPNDRHARAEDVLADLASIRSASLPSPPLASSPAHSSPAHSSPVHSSPAHSQPLPSSPAPSHPPSSLPASGSVPSTARDVPVRRSSGVTTLVSLLVLGATALGGIYLFRPGWLPLPAPSAPASEEPLISAVVAPGSVAQPAPSAVRERSAATVDAAAAAAREASAPLPVAAADPRRAGGAPKASPGVPLDPKPAASVKSKAPKPAEAAPELAGAAPKPAGAAPKPAAPKPAAGAPKPLAESESESAAPTPIETP